MEVRVEVGFVRQGASSGPDPSNQAGLCHNGQWFFSYEFEHLDETRALARTLPGSCWPTDTKLCGFYLWCSIGKVHFIDICQTCRYSQNNGYKEVFKHRNTDKLLCI